MNIDVPPGGGISANRFFAQWRAIRSVMRRATPRVVVLLSCGAETFFAARSIVSEFSSVVFFIVLHGNLNDAIGWRLRDPRRRLFDYRSGIATSRVIPTRLVVLEGKVRSAALGERHGRRRRPSSGRTFFNIGEAEKATFCGGAPRPPASRSLAPRRRTKASTNSST